MARELLVGRGPRGGDGRADAAGGVRLTGHPRLELRGAVAGEHEVRVRVDESGDHGGTADIVARSRPPAHLPRCPNQATRPPSTTNAASCRIGRSASHVTSSPMLVTSARSCATPARVDRRSSCSAMSLPDRPGHPRHSPPTAARPRRPCVRTRRPRSCRPPRSPATRDPSRPRPATAARRSRRPRTPEASRWCISTARASANMSITVLLSEPSVSLAPASRSATLGPMPSASSASVVGQKHAYARASPSVAMSSGVRWVACTAVVRGVHAPASASSATGVSPVAARHSSFSAGCSETWTCSGASGNADATVAQLVAGHGAYGVDRGADHDVVLAGVLARRAPRPASPSASASPSLNLRCTPSGSRPNPAAR